MEEKGSMMNRTIKAAVGMVAIAAMSVGTLAACGGSSSSSDNGKGKVYFLNFKPESNDEWQKLAKDYTKETGVEVKVQTAASGTYEQTLKSEIQVRGSDLVPGQRPCRLPELVVLHRRHVRY